MVSRAGLTVRFAESDVRSMGRDTTGVRGMDVGKDGQVIAMDVARDDMDLLVVTENGYGKRTQIGQYRKTNRGAKGVKTIGLTEKKGGLAGALVVRDHQELVFISVGGMVQRTSAAGISQQGRSATGVRVMNLKDDDLVSAVALVVDPGDEAARGGRARRWSCRRLQADAEPQRRRTLERGVARTAPHESLQRRIHVPGTCPDFPLRAQMTAGVSRQTEGASAQHSHRDLTAAEASAAAAPRPPGAGAATHAPRAPAAPHTTPHTAPRMCTAGSIRRCRRRAQHAP